MVTRVGSGRKKNIPRVKTRDLSNSPRLALHPPGAPTAGDVIWPKPRDIVPLLARLSADKVLITQQVTGGSFTTSPQRVTRTSALAWHVRNAICCPYSTYLHSPLACGRSTVVVEWQAAASVTPQLVLCLESTDLLSRESTYPRVLPVTFKTTQSSESPSTGLPS